MNMFDSKYGLSGNIVRRGTAVLLLPVGLLLSACGGQNDIDQAPLAARTALETPAASPEALSDPSTEVIPAPTQRGDEPPESAPNEPAVASEDEKRKKLALNPDVDKSVNRCQQELSNNGEGLGACLGLARALLNKHGEAFSGMTDKQLADTFTLGQMKGLIRANRETVLSFVDTYGVACVAQMLVADTDDVYRSEPYRGGDSSKIPAVPIPSPKDSATSATCPALPIYLNPSLPEWAKEKLEKR